VTTRIARKKINRTYLRARVKAWHDAHDTPFDDVYGPPEYMKHFFPP
jgi:hypothetical protein